MLLQGQLISDYAENNFAVDKSDIFAYVLKFCVGTSLKILYALIELIESNVDFVFGLRNFRTYELISLSVSDLR